MGAREKIKFYFENGYVITNEEQEAHDKMVAKIVRDGVRDMKKIIISMSKRFATLEKR